MRTSEPFGWGVLLVLVVALLLAVRQDRTGRGPMNDVRERKVIRAVTAPVLPAGDAGMGASAAAPDLAEAKKSLEQARRDANDARNELQRLNDELQQRQTDLQRLAKESDLQSAKAKKELDAARESLEDERAKALKLTKQLEEKAAAIDKEVDLLNKQRQTKVEAAANAAVMHGLGRGNRVEMQTQFDARALRDSFLQPFTANPAAAAAAGPSSFPGASPSISFPGSTAAGDVLRGQAELTRAAGEAAVNSSKAAINMQTSAAMNMENRLRWTETFFEMRRINRFARARERGPAPTLSQCIRYAQVQMPRRLTSIELDPVTGVISWPMVLTALEYRPEVAVVETAFQQRAKRALPTDQNQYETMAALLSQLGRSLKANAAKYESGAYGKAKSFLESLLFEYGQAPR